MAEVTLEIPDSLAASLSIAGNDLPRILELGGQALTAGGRPEYDGMADVLEILARLPTPNEMLALRPTPVLQARIEALLDKNRSDGLEPDEQREWHSYEYLEHLVRMAKAHALDRLRAPGAS